MKKTLLGVGVVLALSGCARDANQPLELWHNFSQTKLETQLGENQALAVFYRQDDAQGGATNIYVDGDYQASLLPNAYSAVAVCADKHLFSTSLSSNQQFGNRTQGASYTLPVGDIAYVKVSQGANGQPYLARVEPSVAEQEIANLPKENQTLSRVPSANNCQPPVVIAAIAVDSNALFAFNKFGYKDILPAGREKLENFMAQVKTLKVSHIVVGGHTDNLGSDSYNQTLSEKRANSVKQQLQQAGITAPVKAIGFGKKEPVVTNCSALTGAAKNQCNLPNRRVEITVYGEK
ncbi:OmpA family protein [Rodentibacter haemolyticus]|uniref:OmpA family protein n=1 Tax=Rodentibacter haemolyticus TaxID=2778911 RepID=A0ABX6UZC4_9PAST|nr:OmpA family protein [Rodentibacter haemolyticus]QPB42995.1 OmpA family protein [Rodentibacter haemolyticus]QPB43129.1 OmpA family protein [Rodentibacter haemolyticus]